MNNDKKLEFEIEIAVVIFLAGLRMVLPLAQGGSTLVK